MICWTFGHVFSEIVIDWFIYLVQVYIALCCAVVALAVGAYLHVLLNIGGFLTMVASIASFIWLLCATRCDLGGTYSFVSCDTCSKRVWICWRLQPCFRAPPLDLSSIRLFRSSFVSVCIWQHFSAITITFDYIGCESLSSLLNRRAYLFGSNVCMWL